MLGRIATKRGDLASAQGDLNRAIAIDQSLLGDANFRTAVIKVDLADAYILGAKYKEAEEILRKAVKVMTTSLPPGDAHIGFAQASWGDALLHLKRYDEAESELTAGYQILEKQSHPPFARIQAVRHDLAAVYDALHQSQNVKQLLRELDSTANK
jgi:tetratricopeptide (TPR) repeat protein